MRQTKSKFYVKNIYFLLQINTQLKKWAENSPIAKRLDITNGNFTVMENPIYMMMVDDPTSGQIVSAKLTIMIVAGEINLKLLLLLNW